MPRHPYPRPDRKTDARDATSFLLEVNVAADTATIHLPAIGQALDMLTRTREHRNARLEVLQNQQAEEHRIAKEMVDGSLDLAGAAAQSATVDSTVSATLSRAVKETEPVAVSRAMDHVGEHMPADLLARCRTIVADTIDEIRALRPALGDARTAEQAVALGADAAVAWARYLELIKRWDAAHELVRLARTQHWITPFPFGPQQGRGAVDLGIAHNRSPRYGKPWLLLDIQRAAARSGQEFLHILDERCDAAEPGGPYDEDENDMIVTGTMNHRDALLREEDALMGRLNAA